MKFEFDVSMTKEEIEKICSDEYIKHIKERYTGYMEMNFSHGKLIKQKYFYPQFLDLYVTIQHGVYSSDNLDNSFLDILQDTKVFLANRKMKSKYKKILVTGNMFVYYKEKNNIMPKKYRKGTVVFPIHSTNDLEWEVDWQYYISELKKLPTEMYPLLICVYYKDVQRGVHNIFIENGFEVTTAGHAKDPKFVERFYNILSSVKYSTSNAIMSSTFYAVDLGVPFFLYGHDDEIKTNSNAIDHVNEKIRYSSNSYKEIRECFLEFKKEIPKETKKEVQKYLGNKTEENNKFYISYILYRDFIKYQCIFLKRKIYKKYLNLIYKKYLLKESLNITNHMELEERLLLIKYTRKVKKGVIVEIGSFLGSNTINLAKNSPNSQIFAIDNWSRHPIDNCKNIFKKNISKFNNIVVLDGEFEEIYKNFNEEIDLLIIDGEHYNDEVIKRDLSLFDKLKKGGIIIIHHYKWSPFVKIAIIDTLKDKTKKIVLLDNIWVGIKNA